MPEDTINMRIGEELMEILEEYMEKEGFDSKSEAIRDMMNTAYFYRIAGPIYAEEVAKLDKLEKMDEKVYEEDILNEALSQEKEKALNKAKKYLDKFYVRDKERRADLGEG